MTGARCSRRGNHQGRLRTPLAGARRSGLRRPPCQRHASHRRGDRGWRPVPEVDRERERARYRRRPRHARHGRPPRHRPRSSRRSGVATRCTASRRRSTPTTTSTTSSGRSASRPKRPTAAGRTPRLRPRGSCRSTSTATSETLGWNTRDQHAPVRPPRRALRLARPLPLPRRHLRRPPRPSAAATSPSSSTTPAARPTTPPGPGCPSAGSSPRRPRHLGGAERRQPPEGAALRRRVGRRAARRWPGSAPKSCSPATACRSSAPTALPSSHRHRRAARITSKPRPSRS